MFWDFFWDSFLFVLGLLSFFGIAFSFSGLLFDYHAITFVIIFLIKPERKLLGLVMMIDELSDFYDDEKDLVSSVMVKQAPWQPISPPGTVPTDLCHWVVTNITNRAPIQVQPVLSEGGLRTPHTSG